MDAQEAIRLLRERTEHEVTLPGDIPAIVKLPNLQECILAGGVPMPVLERMAEWGPKNGNGEAKPKPSMTAEDIQHMFRFRREVAMHTLVGLFGENLDEVTLETVDALPADALDALWAIGNREPGNLLDPNPPANLPAPSQDEAPNPEASVPA